MPLRSSSDPLAIDPNHKKGGLFSEIRDDLQAAGLEFTGTTLFLLIGLGGIQAAAEASISSEYQSNLLTVLYISVVRGTIFEFIFPS